MTQTATKQHPTLAPFVKEWLTLRETLLVSYNTASRIPPFDDLPFESNDNLIDTFCDDLLNYVSRGHMDFYKKLHVYPEKKEQFEVILEAIELHTQCVFLFSQNRQGLNTDRPKATLSKIGEQLADRIELEDKLIQEFL